VPIIKNIFDRIIAHAPPSLWYACACMMGIAAQASASLIPLGSIVLLSESLHRYHHYSRLFAWISIICCALGGAWRLSSNQVRQLAALRTLPQGLCSLTGTVRDKQTTGSPTYPLRITLQAHHIVSPYNRLPINFNGTVKLELQQDSPVLAYGNIVTLSHVLLFTHQSAQHEQYCAKSNVICKGKVTSKNSITLISSGSAVITRWWHEQRQKLVEAASQQLSPLTFQLMAAMFFGYPISQESSSATRELFGWWGLNHLLARSGLHLIMFLILLTAFLTLVPLAFFLKQSITIAVILFYTIMSWPSVSFMRAVCMMLLYSTCLFAKTAPHALHIIACVALGMLWYQPLYLMGLDFQLSFALTFALALINHANKVIQQQIS
jgi:predicted membrane metal-binding protein